MSVKEKIFYALLVVAGALALAWTFFGPSGVKEVARLEEEGKRLKGEVKKLEEKKEILAKRTELMRDDPRLIERKARDVGMVRPDETVIMMPGKKRHGD